MSVCYLDLADYVAIAAEVTGLDVDTLLHVAKHPSKSPATSQVD